jgi:hypothetical protein
MSSLARTLAAPEADGAEFGCYSKLDLSQTGHFVVQMDANDHLYLAVLRSVEQVTDLPIRQFEVKI